MEARTPYRSRLTEPARPKVETPAWDLDLLPMWIPLWLAATSRVIVALVHHETFRADATLALIVMVVIPWLALSPGRRRSHDEPAAAREQCGGGNAQRGRFA